MRTGVSGALAVSLVVFAAGCAKPAPISAPEPAAPAQTASPEANTARVAVHVKGMTKALNLF